MNQHYTKKALMKLDADIHEAEGTYEAAMLSLGESAESDNNTWHDNAAFEQAKMEIDRAKKRLSDLRILRESAVEVEAVSGDTIQVGSTAVLEFSEGKTMTAHLAGHHVSNRSREGDTYELSTSAVLGAAILGAKAGDTVSYQSPAGKEVTVHIKKILE